MGSFTLGIKKWAQRKHLRALQDSVAIRVTGSKAAVNVTSGQYVIVQDSTITGITDGLYKAGANVSAGNAFTSADLTAVSDGGLNVLNDQIATKEPEITKGSEVFTNSGGLVIYRFGRLRAINFSGNGVGLPTVGAIIPSGDRPPRIVRVPASTQTDSNNYWISIGTDGKITLYKAGNAITSGSYFVFFSATYLVN